MKLVRLIKLYLNETYNKVHVFLSTIFQKKETLYCHGVSSFALECAIRKVQEKQVGLKVSGTHQHIKKQTPWPLVRKRTLPTERPPLVDEI
jgi:hypothetical protein